MLWSLILQNRVPIPKDPGYYRLLAKKQARIQVRTEPSKGYCTADILVLQYGVDHSTYSHALADAFGGAPSLSELYWQYGFKILIAYCFGAAFTPFYRLVGPFRSETAPEIIKTEIWEVICRRGLIGNLFMGLIPMIFYGLVSGLALVLETIWLGLKRVGVDVPLPAALREETDTPVIHAKKMS